MKLIHTADWHIGKNLYKEEFFDDFEFFFAQLLELIKIQNVKAVLISGDVFDTANPTHRAKKVYFEAMRRLYDSGAIVIMTAGNHDSIAHLEGAKAMLELFNIHIIGDLAACEPVLVEEDNDKVVIVPIPFIYDRDLRKGEAEVSADQRIALVKQGLTRAFVTQAEKAKITYPNTPAIGMGHLYMHGASTSESEREIGNQSGVGATAFNGLFDYLALGHIHMPQAITPEIKYSGSPIAFSFSEHKDVKGVIIIEIAGNKVTTTFYPINKPRQLVRIKGTYSACIAELEHYSNTYPYQAWAEVSVIEPLQSSALMIEARNYFAAFKKADIAILNYKITFEDKIKQLSKLTFEKVLIQDLNPTKVFEKRLSQEDMPEESKNEMLQTFQELLSEVHQAEA